MKKIISLFLPILLIFTLGACGNDDLIINDLNLGELEHEGIDIMGVTYDFYSHGYAAITAILHENAQLTDVVTYNGESYTVAVLGDIKVEATDLGIRTGVFGTIYSGIKSPVDLILPDSIIVMSNNALEASTAKTIKLPSKITSLGSKVFLNCINIEAIEWPSGMEYIGGSSMFQGCSSLKEVEFPENCEIFSLDYCFSDCTSLESVVIPGTVREIRNMAFSNCPELSSVTLGEGIEKIGEWAFMSCPKLTHLVIPESVTKISGQAFQNCTGLVDLTLPDNLMDVPADLFTDEYHRPTDAAGITIRVRADMVSYVQSIYPAANLVAK